MPILSDSAPTAAQASAHQIRQAFRDSINEAAATLKQARQQVWGVDVVPQDVFDVFGTDGGKYIDMRDACVAFITAMATANGQSLSDFIDSADYSPPGGVTLTVEMDGSITVS